MTTAATGEESAPRLAAAELWRAWREGRALTELPPSMRPRTVDEGWAVQRQLDSFAGPACGWKIAATSAAGQAHIGAQGPLVGRLYDPAMVSSGAMLELRDLTMASAEAEFAFRLGADLDPTTAPLTETRVLAAVAAMQPAIELPGSRFVDFASVGLPSLVADAMCLGKVVIAAPADSCDLDSIRSHQVSLIRNGAVASAGSGADVLGDPCEALVWLARELARRGEMLRSGETVITGACTTPIAIARGDELRADFGSLGEVEVKIAVEELGPPWSRAARDLQENRLGWTMRSGAPGTKLDVEQNQLPGEGKPRRRDE